MSANSNAVVTGGRLLLAGAGGVLVYFSHEPHGHFWAAIFGVALFYFALMPWPFVTATDKAAVPTAGRGALLGYVHAVCLYLPLLPWVGEFVGALPWIALSLSLIHI